MKKKLLFLLTAVVAVALTFAGCAQDAADDNTDPNTGANQEVVNEPVTILVAAAASLEYSYTDELIPMFQEKYDWITVEGTYDSSGKLQQQIEAGLEADVFMSAAMKQMNTLVDESLVAADSVVELLENRIVLIAPADSDTDIASFEDIVNANIIAIGDPASVPAGQYAEEALTARGFSARRSSPKTATVTILIRRSRPLRSSPCCATWESVCAKSRRTWNIRRRRL